MSTGSNTALAFEESDEPFRWPEAAIIFKQRRENVLTRLHNCLRNVVRLPLVMVDNLEIDE